MGCDQEESVQGQTPWASGLELRLTERMTICTAKTDCCEWTRQKTTGPMMMRMVEIMGMIQTVS